MILYDLTCPEEHRFESWFRNSGAVEKLIKAGQVVCPVCGSKKVQKAPMAPLIGKGGIGKSTEEGVPAKPRNGELVAAVEKAAHAINQLREVIEKNFEHVGGKFPEEARRIHYGEAKKRGIYGEASEQDTRALLDEGIEVHPIPGPRRNTTN